MHSQGKTPLPAPSRRGEHSPMTEAQIIVLATPVFLLLIGVELWVATRRRKAAYAMADSLSSIGLGIMSQVVGVFSKLLLVAIYVAVYDNVAPFRLSATSIPVWIGALLLYDFLYYWHHRLGHRMAVLWAAHSVHHQSEEFNLSTALRQTSSGWLFGWIFYLPMALLGVPPLVFGVVALIDLLYQYWVHTEQIGKLGWFDRWFCSPSNHRVHHAVNDRYVDKNYGGILIIWDRLFGSFEDEDDSEKCVYGTRAPLRSWNPIKANLQGYADILSDARRTRSWVDKLLLFVKPPGWRPSSMEPGSEKAPFNIANVRKFAPEIPRAAVYASLTLFVSLLLATSGFLWFEHQMTPAAKVVVAIVLVASLWVVGRITDGGFVVAGRHLTSDR